MSWKKKGFVEVIHLGSILNGDINARIRNERELVPLKAFLK